MATAIIEGNVPAIYRKIQLIQTEVGAIEKRGKGPSAKGSFAYIKAEDILDKIHALLVEHEVIVIPTITSIKHQVIEISNRMNIYSVVEAAYRYIAVEDGSEVTVTVIGEGSDIGSDTATRKAATQAMKISHLHAFTIPNTDMVAFDDREGYTPEDNASAAKAAPQAVQRATSGTTRPAQGTNGDNTQITKLRDEIKAKVEEIKAATEVEPQYGRIGNRLFPTDKSWPQKVPALKKVLAAIEAGEIQ